MTWYDRPRRRGRDRRRETRDRPPTSPDPAHTEEEEEEEEEEVITVEIMVTDPVEGLWCDTCLLTNSFQITLLAYNIETLEIVARGEVTKCSVCDLVDPDDPDSGYNADFHIALTEMGMPIPLDVDTEHETSHNDDD